jgi:CRP/FNR family cyclic AMP-dependent transcriptional regulator
MTNPDSKADIRKHLAATAFGALGEPALEESCYAARIERFKVPTLLSAAGEQPQYLRLVVSGHIEVIARNASGVEFAVGYITPGGWATWLACFMESPPDNDFYSSASACFVTLPVQEVRHLCATYPQIYPLIIRQIGRRMRLLMEWTGQSVLVDSVQRVAKLLHILAREQQVQAGYAKLNVTQARVATLARCSRQTANEILGVLEQKGLLTLAYGSVEIPDLGRLATFADAGPHEQ